MSKRFGRQQVKNLKARIADLERQLLDARAVNEMNEGLLRDTGDKLDRAKWEIDNAKRILGSWSGAFAAEEMAVGKSAAEMVRMGMPYQVALPPNRNGLQHVSLSVLCAEAKHDACGVLHARMTLDGRQIAYAISPTMLSSAGARHMVFTEAAQYMAATLLDAFPKKPS
jgi:hypothetical protein